jgi:hypothetical protein
MLFVRKMLLVLAVSFLPGLLFVTAVTYGVNAIIGKPEPVKEVLKDSGIYSSVTSQVLKDTDKSKGDSSDVSLENKAIKKAALSIFSPSVVEENSEKAIDGIYNWLEGDTPLPDFSLNFTSLKAQFASKVGKEAQKRAAKLPICALGTFPKTTDPFKANCLPYGITPKQIGEQTKNDILKGEGFLEDPVLSAENIKSENSNLSVFADQYKNVPPTYQKLQIAPVVFGVLSLIAAAAIILLSPTKVKGLFRVGVTIIVIGIAMLIFAWVFNYGVNNRLLPNIQLENNILQNNLKKLIADIAHRIDINYWIFGGAYSAIGALAIGGAVLLRSKVSKPATASTTKKSK